MQRRTFIRGTVTSAVLATAAGAGLLRATRVLAAPWPAQAFRARTTQDVVSSLFDGESAASTKAVQLLAPTQGDGGAIPVKVRIHLRDVEGIAIVADHSPNPLRAAMRVHGAVSGCSCRIRMTTTSAVTAYVQADGALYSASTSVKISRGGYGMTHRRTTAAHVSGHSMSVATKMKLRNTDKTTEILVLVNHPMESGQRTDPESHTHIPAHYIETMSFHLNGALVAEANLGPGIAANPVTGIVLDNTKPGDSVTVSWRDNRGLSGGAEAVVG